MQIKAWEQLRGVEKRPLNAVMWQAGDEPAALHT
jgi:hypothetical protein